MKLLITGGCGFIGSNYIRMTLKNYPDDDVVNLDALTYAGNPDNLKDLAANPRYTFIRGDIGDAPFVDALFAEHKFTAVINFAAESHVDRSIKDAAAFLQTNILG